ncbi:hypothetical protein Bbelb_446320 [Branchiostoma belcheri]|nr:hypothetical protein Bbelb_446320 [Branchiostoma belcheri]
MEAVNATAATLAPAPPYGVAVVSVGCLLLIVVILMTIFCLVETTDDKDDKLLADLEAMDPKGKDPEVQMLRLEYKLKAATQRPYFIMEATNATAVASGHETADPQHVIFSFVGGVVGILVLAAMLFWLYRRLSGREQLYIPDIELLEPEDPTPKERYEQLDKKLRECGL